MARSVKIPLTRGYHAVVDAKDRHLVEGYPWCAISDVSGKTYAVRGRGSSRVLMHHVITNSAFGERRRPSNGDYLDCRRENFPFDITRYMKPENTKMTTDKPKSRKGFASMTPERRKEVSARGGASVKPENRSFSRDAELAKRAGVIGGSVKKTKAEAK